MAITSIRARGPSARNESILARRRREHEELLSGFRAEGARRAERGVSRDSRSASTGGARVVVPAVVAVVAEAGGPFPAEARWRSGACSLVVRLLPGEHPDLLGRPAARPAGVEVVVRRGRVLRRPQLDQVVDDQAVAAEAAGSTRRTGAGSRRCPRRHRRRSGACRSRSGAAAVRPAPASKFHAR